MAALLFSETELFPLLETGAHSYPEEQEHSLLVDQYLGLRIATIEAKLLQQKVEGHLNLRGAEGETQETWVGLSISTFLTPYTEIRTMLSQLPLKPGQTIVDLGAGYGRMGFVVARHFPEIMFLGYEFLPERASEGQRCFALHNLANATLLQKDLSDCNFSPLPADYYFIYDFGNRDAIEKVLFDLQFIAKSRGITVIGRGRGTRDAIERRHYWLCEVEKAQHFPHYSIYRSSPIDKE